MKNSLPQKLVQVNLLFVLLLTFYSSQTSLNAQTVRWVNNQGESRPATVTVQGNSYSTAATTYTDIQVAINSSNSGDIILITDGTYRNPQESISTACSLFGTSQDSLLYLEVFKSNLLIISETGDYRTSSARLVGYGFSSRNNNKLDIQGLHMDSIRVNAFWAASGYGYGPATNSTIKNNKVTNTRGHGIKTDSDGSTTINRGTWVIEGNYFENIGFYNGNGNCLTPAGVSAIWLAEAGQYFTIKGNVIKNTKWAGILCDGYGGFGSTNGSVIIRENQINTTVNSGIQVGISSANFYYPYNAIIKKNKIENANTSADTTVGAVTILHSNVRGVIIDSNHITSSHNGIAIDIAGWQDSPDTTYINYNNFCSLSGGFAIHHTIWASTCCSTADNLLKYDIENNFWGDASGPTYATNPSGTGEALQKDATKSGNDFDFLPFATTPFAIDTFNVNSCPVASPNNSMRFNGTSQYVEVPYSAALNSATFTFEAYAKVDGNTGTFQSVMTNRQSSSAGYVFYYNPGNKWIYWGNGGDKNISGIPATLGQWYHLAVTHDGTTHKFYIDGELVGTKVAANVVNTTNELRIGAGETGSSPQYFFKGEIDEVRFWNVAKTQSEIQTNMNIALSPQTNLVAYYNFDQSSGALQDQSGNGHHGTLYGNPSYIASTVPCMTAFTTINTSLVCNSDNNGQITASASSSSTPFSYIWSNSSTSTSITGLSAGTYSVTVTDNVGCIDSASVVLSQPTAVVANISQTNVSCNGNADGSATASVSGGTSPYNYIWSNGITSSAVSGVAAGSFTVTVTDNNGCLDTTTATITQPTPINFNVTSTDLVCQNDGAIDLTASGGTSPYSYTWSNGATTEDLTGLSTGSYYVTISDANGCSITANDSVGRAPGAISLTTTNSDVNCFGGNDGAITVNVTNGTAPYTYTWSDIGVGTNNRTNLAASTYSVTTTDQNGCDAFITTTITEPAVLIAATVVNSNVSCNGNTDGSATVTASGGTSPYTYIWSNGTTTTSVTGVAAGNLMVTVTDNNGCSDTSSANITQPTILNASIASQTSSTCNGNNDGSATVSASGGTSPYTYIWSNGTTTAAVTGVAAGNLTVTITDNNSCMATTTATITEPAAINGSISQTNVSCNGGSDGSATAAPTGGTSPYTYIWSNGTTSAAVTGVAAGTYFTTITDINGCLDIKATTITEPTAVNASIDSLTNVSCNGNADGSATASVSGGNSPYSYIWSNGTTSAAVTGVATGNLTLTITDNNGCSDTASVTITQSSAVNASIASQTNVSCNGNADGSATASVSGGTSPYTYLWSNGTTSAAVTGVTASNLMVTITDNNGCSGTTTATITQPSAVNASIASQTNVSCNGSADGAVTASVSGGTSPYTYLWSNGTTSAAVTGVAAGNITVTITDNNGCSDTTSSLVTATDTVNPVASAQNITVYLDLTGTVFVPASNLDNSSSDNCSSVTLSSSQTSFTCADLGSNSVTLTVTDGSSNSSTAISTVTVIDSFPPTASAQNITVYLNGSGTASITASDLDNGSIDNCSLPTLSANKTSFTCSDLGANTVTLTATDGSSNASTAISTVTVIDTTSPTATAQNVTVYLNGSGTASIVASDIDNGSADNCSSVILSASKTSFTCSDIGTNSVTLTVTDGSSNSSTAISTVTVADTSSPIASAQNVTVYLSASGNAFIPASSLDNGSSDNCSSVTLSSSQTSFSCADLGSNSVTLTATDGSSNFSTAISTVTVIDSFPPTALAQNITVYLNGSGTASITASDLDNGSSDVCSSVSLSANKTSFTCSDLGANSVTLTATDASSNSSIALSTVTVVDTTSPAASAQNITVYLNGSGTASIVASDIDNGSADNCSSVTLSASKTSFTCADIGANSVTLTATDANSNSSTAISTVTVVDSFPPVAIAQNITIYLNGSGTASITAANLDNGSSDNCSSLTFSASKTSFNCADLGANTVTLTATDGSSNSSTAISTVTVADTITPTWANTTISNSLDCFGDINGQVTASASGRTSPFTYLWSNGATTASISSLVAGSYYVTITDGNGCSDSSSVTLIEPTQLTASASVITNASCNGASDGAATVTASGGTSPYSYSWSNGDTSATISSLAAGTYSATITDNNGCSDTSSVTISQSSVVNASIASQTNVSCNGNSDGSATASVSGGNSPYYYIWSNGTTSATVTGVAAGNLTVTISDNNGCSSTTTAAITQPSAVTASIDSLTNVSCNGNADGSATASVSGGNSPYTYLWSNGTTSAAVTGVAAGNLTVTITDNNGCSGTTIAAIAQPSAVNASIDSLTNVSCNGNTDGSATASVSGGNSPYTYLWSNGTTSAAVTGVAAGNLTVTVTDNNGCSGTTTAVISQPSAVNASIDSLTNVSCNGNADGSATASVSGGNSPYTYLWSNGTTSAAVTGVAAGNLTLTITDNNGCSDTASVTITQSSAVNASIDSLTNASCNGNADGSATASVSGGNSPYTYLWSNGTTSAAVTGVTAGNLTVTITDNNGCSGTTITTITQPSAVNASIDSLTNASCNGNADGSATASVSGGTSPYTYLWSNGTTSNAVTGVAAGNLTVTITDNNGCSGTTTTTITQPSAINANIVSQTNVSCNGSADGATTASATGGTSPYTYTWSNGASTASISGLSAGTYSATITDINGCSDTSSSTITQPSVLTASTSLGSNASCNGSADGSASASATGGTSPYSYSWSNGDTSATISSLIAGTYFATITDNNGCSDTSSVTITQSSAVNASIDSLTNTSCNGNADGSATASASGGNSPYTYLWSNGTTSAAVTGVAAGNLAITITDNNGCFDTSSVTITQPASMLVSIVIDSIPDCVSSANGGATSSASGGTTPYTYLWSNSSTNESISGVAAGTYAVTVTDNNGCTLNANTTITILDTIKPTAVAQNITVFLNGTGNATITPSDIDNGSSDNCSSITLAIDSSNFDCSELGVNTVKLYATDGNANVDSAMVIVTVLDTTNPAVVAQNLTVYLDATGYATITAADIDNGSADNCSGFTLTIDSANFDCSMVGANLVKLYVTDASANIDSATAIVTVLDTTNPTVIAQNLTVYLDASGNAIITATDIDNGSADNCTSITLAIDSANFDCSEVGANPVKLYVTDANANIDSASVVVTVLDTITPIVVAQNITVYLDGTGNATITATDIDNGSVDNCSGITLGIDSSSFDCSNIGPNAVKLTVTDGSANSSFANATVTVMDTLNPIVIAQNINVYLDANGAATITTADIDNGSSDNCSTITLSLDSTSFDCSEVGANTVKLFATDANANVDSATAIVTVLDTINPTVIAQNFTVYLDATGNATITAADIDNGSADNCSSITLAIDSANFDCSKVGANPVKLYVTDANANIDSASVVVTVLDTITPTVVAQNITVYLDGTGNATITAADIDNGSVDNCSGFILGIDSSSFDCSNIGPNAVKLTVTDGSANSSFANATVTVMDTLNPIVIAQNINVYLDANGAATITTADIDNGSADNCSTITLSLDSTSFDCSEVGANTVKLFATDANANVDSATAIVTVLDTINPTVIAQNLTVYLDATGNATITAADIDNGSNDNCSSITLAIDSANFDCSEVGTNPVKLYVTDANANIDSASVVVTVLDTLTPIVIAQNITVYLDATGSATITAANIDNGSNDNCSAITLALDSTNFDCAETGANTIKLYVTDANSNIDSSTSIVTVLDTLIPTISGCPANISVSTDANSCDAVVTWTAPTALDNCIVDSLVSNFTPGSSFPIGVTTITYISYDPSMNTDTCQFTITVTDTEDPVIANIPAPIAVNNDAGNCSAIVNWALPTATDNCTLDSLSGNFTPGDVFPVGTTTVTYIAYDPEMNTDTINFDITVSDNEAPVITCQADTSTCDQIVNYSVPTAIDNCPSVSVVQIAGLASGSSFPYGQTVNTYVAEDAVGNKDTCSFTVTVFETPSIAFAGVDTNICEGTYPLSASTITVGNGLWSSTDTSITFGGDSVNPAATASNLKRGANILIWTVSNGVCDPSIDTVIVTFDNDPTIANAGSDIVLCELNLATFDANAPVIGNGVWSILSGNGQFANVNDPTTDVEVSDNTFNSFIWTISNGTCASSSDTINVKAASNPTANAGDSIFIYKDDGVQLNVESDSTNLSYVWTPSFSIEGSNTVQSPYARPSETTEYTVVVTTDDGCFTTDRILVTVSDLLKIPTAFTPDGDGVNDTWDIKNTEELTKIEVIVYNGNGNEVFSSASNYAPWDGKYEGKDLEIGSYYYVVKATDFLGTNLVKTGIVSILR